jgi:hypothetical protein
VCARLFLCFINSCALVSQADRSVPKGGACDIYGRSSKLSAGAVLEPAPVIATYLRPPTVEPGDAHACTRGQCVTVFDYQPASFLLAHSQRQTCPRPATIPGCTVCSGMAGRPQRESVPAQFRGRCGRDRGRRHLVPDLDAPRHGSHVLKTCICASRFVLRPNVFAVL